MAYPEDLDSKYNLRNYNFAVNDNNILPYDESLFKSGYRNADESDTLSVADAHNVNWMYDILYRNLRYTKDTAVENKNLLANKIATPTTIGQIKVGQGLRVLSDGTLTLENPMTGDKQSITYDIPVGMFMLWSGSSIPEYFIEPDGTSRLKADYPELITYATENGLYGEGKLFYDDPSDNTKFIVSDMRDAFIKTASSVNDIGIYTPDGLPALTIPSSGNHSHSGITGDDSPEHYHARGTQDITGSTTKTGLGLGSSRATFSGAFSGSTSGNGDAVQGGWDNNEGYFNGQLNFQASRAWTGRSSGAVASDGITVQRHQHSFNISNTGTHTHNITHSAQTREDNKVMPRNWSLRLILKAKPSPQVRTVPIGTILDYSGTVAPDGFIIANGYTILKNGHEDLYNWAVQNDLMKPYSEYANDGTPHSCYYEGPTNNTFIIPNLIGVYRRGENEDIGIYEQDSAPDIQGTFLTNDIGSAYLSGSFNYTGESITPGFTTSGTATSIVMDFKASNNTDSTLYPNGNPYGRKKIIQPKTVRTLPILKY
jgi:hypothetical protein